MRNIWPKLNVSATASAPARSDPLRRARSMARAVLELGGIDELYIVREEGLPGRFAPYHLATEDDMETFFQGAKPIEHIVADEE